MTEILVYFALSVILVQAIITLSILSVWVCIRLIADEMIALYERWWAARLRVEKNL